MESPMKIVRCALVTGLAIALSSLSAQALAQWVWKDDAGHTVYSDQPPPMDVPESRIIKHPDARSPAPAADQTTGDDGKDSKAAKNKSTADLEKEFEKRQKDKADADKKAQDDTAKKQQNAQRCA